jgi:hypothetical protein
MRRDGWVTRAIDHQLRIRSRPVGREGFQAFLLLPGRGERVRGRPGPQEDPSAYYGRGCVPMPSAGRAVPVARCLLCLVSTAYPERHEMAGVSSPQSTWGGERPEVLIAGIRVACCSLSSP